MGSPTGRVTAAASSTSQMPPRSPGPERGPAHAAAALLHSPGLRTAAGCRGRGNWVQIHLGSSGTPAPPPPVSVDEPSAPRPGETGGLVPKETEQRRQTKPCGRVGGGRGNLHTNRRPPPQPRRQSPPRGKCRKERWLAGRPAADPGGWPGKGCLLQPSTRQAIVPDTGEPPPQRANGKASERCHQRRQRPESTGSGAHPGAPNRVLLPEEARKAEKSLRNENPAENLTGGGGGREPLTGRPKRAVGARIQTHQTQRTLFRGLVANSQGSGTSLGMGGRCGSEFRKRAPGHQGSAVPSTASEPDPHSWSKGKRLVNGGPGPAVHRHVD